MSTITAGGFAVFILILFIGIYLSLFGLPGTVIIFLDVLTYAAITGFERIGLKVVIFLFLFSIVAETIDILLGMTGALKPVPSKKSFGFSVIGALTGVCLLTPFLFGLGAFGGFFLGCLAGILLAEFVRQIRLQAPFKASKKAVYKMVGGKLTKGFIALIMITFSLSNIYS